MISAIAIIGKNRELGSENKLLWHIPGELPRFKRITMGHPIIMGRKTFESIGKILPGRTNIIITRDVNYSVNGAVKTTSLEEALEEAKKAEGSEEIFIIGGGQIFEQAIPIINRIYLTLVNSEFPGADTFFPEYSDFTKIIDQENLNGPKFDYEFITLERK